MTRMSRIAKVYDFLDAWPDAEFGPGRIVLSDFNLERRHIDTSVERTTAALAQEDTSLPGHEFAKSQDFWIEHTQAELQATLDFLEIL